MGQKKLIKFAAIKEYEHVLEYPQGMQGKWSAFFQELAKGTVNISLDDLAISQPSENKTTETSNGKLNKP